MDKVFIDGADAYQKELSAKVKTEFEQLKALPIELHGEVLSSLAFIKTEAFYKIEVEALRLASDRLGYEPEDGLFVHLREGAGRAVTSAADAVRGARGAGGVAPAAEVAVPASSGAGGAAQGGDLAGAAAVSATLAIPATPGAASPEEQLRFLLAVCDPKTIILLDGGARSCFERAFMEFLPRGDSLDAKNAHEQEKLEPLREGELYQILGRRVMYLGDFAFALKDAEKKKIMWSRLKKLPQLKEPY